MRISARGRYALAATIRLTAYYSSGEPVSLLTLSAELGISKIYLEQVFALLKRDGVVESFKGAQGGYRLALPPQQINARSILFATEAALFEPTEASVQEAAPQLDAVMQEEVFSVLDQQVTQTLDEITLADLHASVLERSDEGYMYYI